MTQIGTFTPDQARMLWQDYLQRKKPAVKYTPQEVGQHRVFVLNTEAEEIPPYACLEIVGTEEVGGRTAITVRKPTTTSGEYLFNSQYTIPVAGVSPPIAGVGWAYRYGVVVMQGDGSTDDGQYQPVVDSWEITPGNGPFLVFGVHNGATSALIGRLGNTATFISPSTTGACGCSSVTGVIPATTAAFGTDYLLAYRWQLPGIMSVLNDHGFSLTVEPTLIYDGGEWVSEVLTRNCGSSITDEYYITLEEHATHSWLLRIGLPDGATPNCDDVIEWFAVFNGPLGTAYPAATNPLRWSILSMREEQST